MKEKVLKACIGFMLQNGYPPTIAEISDIIGMKRPNEICECLEMLEIEGKLTWERGKSRTIQIPGMKYVYEGKK